MTAKAQDWAWKLDLSLPVKAVLLVLCDCINKDDEFAHPSQDFIAKRIKRSTRQVRTHLKTLAEANLIRIVAGPGKGRGRASDLYEIACDHRTGESRVLEGPHKRKSASDCERPTRGSRRPPETVADDLTGGRNERSQAEVSDKSPTPPNIAKPEIEPELALFAAEKPPKSAKPKKPKALAGSDLPGFPELWAIWKPKDGKASTGRKPCSEAYAKALRGGAEPGRILAGARKYLAQPGWDRDHGAFMKGLVPFLNQEIWMDLTEGLTADGSEGLDPAFLRATEDQLRAIVSMYRESGRWPSGCGKPLEHVPAHIRVEFGYGAAA